ncbi:MAG: hypothetical protein MR350_01705 [Alphaproteobacteria bacterium]|nr:hypothetical protein [Alphaproteobacteria bacterium]
MKFLEILGLSAVITAGISLFACVTAWLCTYTIGSWLVLALFAAYAFYVCVKAGSGQTLSYVLLEEVLPVCIGLCFVLGLFWFAGHLMTSSLSMQVTIGYNVVWGVLLIMCAAALFFTLIIFLSLLDKAFDMMFLKKHCAFNYIQSYLSFIVSLLCSLAILIGVMYYILYPIGLA